MAQRRVLVMVMLLWVLPACGPSLRTVQSDVSYWTSSQECAQGPFELSWKTRGLRWGEGMVAEVTSDRPLFGKWRLELQGNRVAGGFIATRRAVRSHNGRRETVRWVRDDPNKPSQCAPTDRDPEPTVMTASAHAQPAPEPEAGPQTSVQASVEVEQRVEVEVAGELQAGARFIAARGKRKGRHRHRFARWVHSDTRLEKAVVLPANGDLTLRIWSDRPQHWAGAVVRIATIEMRPNVSEAEFVAHLRIKEQERAEKRRQRQVEYRRKLAERRASGRRTTRTQRRRTTTRRTLSKAEIAVISRRRAERRIVWQARVELNRARRYMRQAVRPDGPPPAPYDEIAPPRPDRGARWIAGHWRWQGRTWVWVHGWWKVAVRRHVVTTVSTTVPAGPPPPPSAPPNSGVSIEIRQGCDGKVAGIAVRGRLHGRRIGGYIGKRCPKHAPNAGKSRPATRAR